MPKLAERHISYALTMDGTDGYVDFNDNFDKERTDSFSFSFWLYPRDRTAFSTLFQKRNLSAAGYDCNYGNKDGKIQCLFEGSNGNALNIETTNEISINKWHHIVITYDGSSGASGFNIYIDGSVAALTTNEDGLNAAMTNATDFRIGARDDNSNVLDGMITDLRIHNAELTAAQVSDAYFNNIQTSVQDHINMSEGAGTTTTSTGSVAGTITTPVWSTDSPFNKRVAERDMPYSLNFDSASDDVVIDGNELSTGASNTAYSVAAWVRPDVIEGTAQNIYTEGSSSSDTPFIGLNVNTSGQAAFSIRNDSNVLVVSTGTDSIVDGKWHLLVGVRDGNVLNIYVDGKIVATATDATLGNDDVTVNQSAIGVLRRTSEANWFGGGIINVRGWSVTLTASEVENLYYNNVIPQAASLVKEYKFTDGAGTTLTDTGTGGDNGTISGAVWSTNTPF